MEVALESLEDGPQKDLYDDFYISLSDAALKTPIPNLKPNPFPHNAHSPSSPCSSDSSTLDSDSPIGSCVSNRSECEDDWDFSSLDDAMHDKVSMQEPSDCATDKDGIIIFQEMKEWSSRGAGQTQTSASSTESVVERTSCSTRSLSSVSGNRKRSRYDRYANSEDSDDEGTPKQPKRNSINSQDTRAGFGFACPYRKHNPRKYNIFDWRLCAMSKWDSGARVKEHLFRRHRAPIHCSRCFDIFKSEDLLLRHSRAPIACEVRPSEPIEGINAETEKRLRIRKRASPGQSEEDRWRDIYRLLFPGEDIPSPYFEPIPADFRDVVNFYDYFRQELPELFRSHLEMTSNDIADDIKIRLVAMIQNCQEELFLAYRSRSTVIDHDNNSGLLTKCPADSAAARSLSGAPPSLTATSSLDCYGVDPPKHLCTMPVLSPRSDSHPVQDSFFNFDYDCLPVDLTLDFTLPGELGA